MAALVTGASSGIGREIARVCAREGHDLVIVARSEGRLAELADELRAKHGARVNVLPKDLSLETSANEIAEELASEGIQVDILVNNAGFDVFGRFADTDLERELDLLHVNVVALTQLTKLFVRGMRERGYGRVLNLGSTGSFVPAPLNAVYAASKSYVLSFSEAIGEELRGTGVTVTTLCPGRHQERVPRARRDGAHPPAAVRADGGGLRGRGGLPVDDARQARRHRRPPQQAADVRRVGRTDRLGAARGDASPGGGAIACLTCLGRGG